MNERQALRKAFRKNPRMAQFFKNLYDQGKLKVAEESDSNEPLMVLCKRWPGLVDHCRMALCNFCGSEVALAPSSQQIVDNAKVEVRYCCMECFSEGKVEKYEEEQKAKEEEQKAREAEQKALEEPSAEAPAEVPPAADSKPE